MWARLWVTMARLLAIPARATTRGRSYPLGFARRVGTALQGSSGQGCLG